MILLILNTLTVLLFIVAVLFGEKYSELCAPLDGEEYPLKSFYTIGYGLSLGMKLFKIPKVIANKVRKSAVLLYGETYADFYTSAIWAQFLSYTLLVVNIILLFGVFIDGSAPVFIVVSAVSTGLAWWVSISTPEKVVKQRAEECEEEFPDAVGKLALLINSGMVLREAWRLTAMTREGELYRLMRRVVDMMDNGTSDIEALYKFGVLSGSQEIKKFSSAVMQSLEKGGGNLADYLMEQASALLEANRQVMLRKGEAAAGKLIAPIGIMFLGVMIIIIVAALQSMAF